MDIVQVKQLIINNKIEKAIELTKKMNYYENILSTIYDVYENILGQKLDD